MSHYSPATHVDPNGRLVRDTETSSCRNSFSVTRFLLVVILGSVMILTNPANELYDSAMAALDRILPLQSGRQREWSEWKWHEVLDPPVSVTNYGIFTMEERHATVKVLGLTTSWSCTYFDETYGAYCNALSKNLCHGKPLLYDPKSYAYTSHRTICGLIVLAAIVSFCFPGGRVPTSEPFFRILFTSVGRFQFSLFTLAMDLFNASNFVYPALVRLEQVVPTLQDGLCIAKKLNLPDYVDYILYVVVLVLILGGSSNSIATYWMKQPCTGFDSTVAAAVAYCSAFSSFSSSSKLASSLSFNHLPLMSPQSMFWLYVPVTALLGGNASHVVSWLLAGMLGRILAQYHLDNQNVWRAISQMFQNLGAEL